MGVVRIEHLAKIFPSQPGEILDLVLAEMDRAGLSDDVETAAIFLGELDFEAVDLKHTAEIGQGIVRGKKPEYWPFYGRGYIQLTWKRNYAECAKALGIDCVNHPELLEEPEWAMRSAVWFYTSHGLHRIKDVDIVSTRINGTGITAASRAGRRQLYETAKRILQS